MSDQDPVLEVLSALKGTLPDSLQPLVPAYEEKGVDGLDEAWKAILKAAIDED